MALFGRRRNRRLVQALAGAPEGTARILVSEPKGASGSHGTGETILDLELNVIGTRKYRFELEVRVPGQDPYVTEGLFEVPRRAENLGPMNIANALKPGLELPVLVDPDDRGRLAIDWDAFMADPGRKDAVRSASESGRRTRTAKELAGKPKLQEKLRAGNRIALEQWVEAVRLGNMSREEFDRSVDEEIESGRMDPADAEAARAALG